MAKEVTIKGVKGKIKPSPRKNKKWMFEPNNKNINPIHAGDPNATISPGTERGDNYCARSSGIKSSKKLSPNDLARFMWNCNGKKSVGKKSKGL